MESQSTNWERIEQALEEIAEMQKNMVFGIGRRIVPSLTSEDVLQPNDYPVLNNHPEFRYEEGVLAGIYSVQMALRALKKEV